MFLVDTASGNSLLPDDTKPLPEAMVTTMMHLNTFSVEMLLDNGMAIKRISMAECKTAVTPVL